MKFKKIAVVLGSMFMIGSTLGMVTPIMPTPFADNTGANTAIVYGNAAAPSDLAGATLVDNYFKSFLDNTSINDDGNSIYTGDFTDSLGVNENEVVLGSKLTSNGKLMYTLTDNKIPSLIDGKIYWEDGINTKTSFNVHEEILLGSMKVITTFDDSDLNGTALTNNKDLEYRYVFEDDLNLTRIGHEDADTLKINILGKEYIVEEFESDSITISTSKEKIFATGESIIIDGTKLTIEDIFEDVIQINGEFIRPGHTKRVDGIEIRVDSIAYHSSDTLPSKVILKVGNEISTTYNNRESYINQDESDPLWVWSINNPGEKDGYIGVKYDQRELDSDDNLVYIGKSYTFPENYATVQFESLTDVEYREFELSFDSSKDLYYANSNNTKMYEDVEVVTIGGSYDDSFLINGVETSEIYLYYDNVGNDSIKVFYRDVNRDFADSIKPRYTSVINLNGSQVGSGNIGSIIFEDTTLAMSVDFGEDRIVSISGLSILLNKNGSFEYLGSTKEQSENGEIILDNKEIGEKEETILSHNGLILRNPKSNANEDGIVFKVPSEQVYASINVLGQGQEVTNVIQTNSTDIVQTDSTNVLPQLGSIIVKDTEVSSVATKNLIVVGGSCINAVAAKLLGSDVPLCGAEWSAKTNVGEGQYIIQEYASPYADDKVALLVAGYSAEGTTVAVNTLLAK